VPPCPRLNQLHFAFAYDGIEDEARGLLECYLTEARLGAPEFNWAVEPTRFPSGQRILERDRHLQAEALVAALVLLVVRCRSSEADQPGTASLLGRLISRLARRVLPLRQGQPERLVGLLADHAAFFTVAIPIRGVLRVLRRHVNACGLDDGLESGLRRLQAAWSCDWYINPLTTVQQRIAGILSPGSPRREEPCKAPAEGEDMN